jgi:hypothetical protein
VSSPYRKLLDLARLEQALVNEKLYDELEALREEWAALTAQLPGPTPEDRKLLEEIELTIWTTVAQTRLELEEAIGLMALLERDRRAVGGYAGVSPVEGSFSTPA